MQRAWTKLLGLAFATACLAYFLLQAWKVAAATPIAWRGSPALEAMPAAMLGYLGAYAALALAWHCLLRGAALAPRLRCSIGIYLSAQIAKYLPGNVGQHVGRVVLATAHGLSGVRVGLTLLVEMALVVGVSCVLALPLAPMVFERVRAQGITPLAVLAIALGLAACAAVVLYLFRQHRIVGVLRTHLLAVREEARGGRGARWLGGAVALIVAGLLLAGGALALMVTAAMPSASWTAFATVIAVFCAAWVAGFLVPGAPAGVGIREAVLLAGLSPLLDRAAAVEVTLLFRALSLVADVAAFGVGHFLLRAGRRTVTPHG